MKHPLSIFFIFALSIGILSSCVGDQKEEDKEEDAVTSTNTPAPPNNPSTSTTTTSGTTTASNPGEHQAFLITPEQLSNSLYKALGVRLGWDDEGVFFDMITGHLAVPLGGVDFRAQSHRKRQPGVQTSSNQRFLERFRSLDEQLLLDPSTAG